MLGGLARRPLAACSRRLHAARGGHRSGEAGFTLVELLIASSLGLVVLGGTSDFLLVSLHQANAATSRTATARRAELFLARLTREVRQAQYITSTSTGENTTPVSVTYGSGSSSVSFYLPVAGSSGNGTHVTWTCTAKATCTRQAGAGTAVTELKGVYSAEFLPYSASGSQLESGSSASYPSSIRLTLSVYDLSQQDSSQSQVASGVNNQIAVQDGVDLRNYS